MTTHEGTTDEATANLTTELAGVHSRLDALADAVEKLRSNTDKIDEYRRLRTRDRDAFDELHRENLALHQDQLTQAMAPLLRGLISLYDLMQTAPPEDSTVPKLLVQLVQTLDVNGVTVYTPEPGEDFDSKRQDGMPTPTDQPDEHDKVARLRKAGFLRSGTVVRAAEVDVYRLRQPSDATTAN